MRFADGTLWTIAALTAGFTSGTAGDDQLLGFEGSADSLDGGTGDDLIQGLGGAIGVDEIRFDDGTFSAPASSAMRSFDDADLNHCSLEAHPA